ncbi:MAG: hypothetical protein K6D03_01000 [Solobacterium sp.]|nr:hypothetical protein [Solobacterium sp.]
MITIENEELIKAVLALKKINFSSVVSGITMQEYGILKAIDEYKGESVCVSYVTNCVDDLPQAVSRSLKNMEKENLIVRSISAEDRRFNNLQLTEEGRRKLSESRRILEEIVMEALEDFNDERTRELAVLLNQLRESFQAAIKRRR